LTSRTDPLRRLLVARGLRAFGDGYISLLLPVYLLSLGFSAFDVGIIATATLLGSGALTLLLGLCAHRFRTRSLLLAAAGLMAATGISFVAVSAFWPLVVVAVFGTLNPSSGDVSVFLPLEHAMLAHVAPEKQRTSWFARYSLVGALMGAGGAVCAGLPEWLASAGLAHATALKAMFVLYALLGAACALVYRRLPAPPPATTDTTAGPLRHSRRIVFTLAALFSLDAFAGGLIVQSLLALWLLERFALSVAAAGVIFFWTGVLSAFSYLVAVRIANRIGLVYTMVFTHLPSSVLLILVPFAPNLATCIGLLLLRSALSQMGRSDTKRLRDVRGATRRARGSRQRDIRATQPRVGDRTAVRRLPVDAVGFRLATRRRGRAEDRLRPAAAHVLPHVTRTASAAADAAASGSRRRVTFTTMSHGEADSASAWIRLAITLALSTIGGVGMWSVVVACPRFRRNSVSRAPMRRCRTR
jgi:MFS family permease